MANPLAFENAGLLKFLGYVDAHAATGKSIAQVSNLLPPEIAIATQVAIARRFVVKSNSGCLVLTYDGRRWVEQELGLLCHFMMEHRELP